MISVGLILHAARIQEFEDIFSLLGDWIWRAEPEHVQPQEAEPELQHVLYAEPGHVQALDAAEQECKQETGPPLPSTTAELVTGIITVMKNY